MRRERPREVLAWRWRPRGWVEAFSIPPYNRTTQMHRDTTTPHTQQRPLVHHCQHSPRIRAPLQGSGAPTHLGILWHSPCNNRPQHRGKVVLVTSFRQHRRFRPPCSLPAQHSHARIEQYTLQNLIDQSSPLNTRIQRWLKLRRVWLLRSLNDLWIDLAILVLCTYLNAFPPI